MAEASATLRVKADTSEARKELKGTASEAERLKDCAERARNAIQEAAGMAGGGGPPTPPNPTSVVGAYEKAWYRSKWVKNQGFQGVGDYSEKSKSIDDERRRARLAAEELGRVAGRALAKFVVGFMANQVVGTVFDVAKKVGRGNERIEQAAQTVQGAIQWGTAGAQLAGPLGAVAGSLLGGLNSFILGAKQIRDEIKAANQEYNNSRKIQRWESGQRRGEMAFNAAMANMTADERASEIHGRAERLTGGGMTGRQFWKRYKDAAENDAEAWAEMRQQMADALEAELHNGGRDASGQLVSIAGNVAGTRNFYEILSRFAQEEFGKNDAKRTQQIYYRRDSMNARIDSLRDNELGTYLGELERLRGAVSGMTAITDSASSKGLGVGAQIGAMNNERLLRGIDRVVRAIQISGDKSVDAIRAGGGVLNAVTRAM